MAITHTTMEESINGMVATYLMSVMMRESPHRLGRVVGRGLHLRRERQLRLFGSTEGAVARHRLQLRPPRLRGRVLPAALAHRQVALPGDRSRRAAALVIAAVPPLDLRVLLQRLQLCQGDYVTA